MSTHLKISSILACLLLAVSLCAFALGSTFIADLQAESPPGFWGYVKSHINLIQTGIIFLSLVVFIIFVFLLLFSRTTTENKSFWEAFPFASLIFFIVSAFMICDMAQNGGSGAEPTVLLLKLGHYLLAAIVTGIVVLFGTHLVRFESRVSKLTNKTEDAANSAGKAAESTQQFLGQASDIDRHLRELTSTAGLAILALRSDAEYRKASPEFSKGDKDRYIASRSGQALMSDEAICVRADHVELEDEFFPSARNMISSFLAEMAWDLGERCIVTNARNYTSFLVGAARGFEDIIRKTSETDGENRRVFYLTHTLISPAHLLNWPKTVRRDDNPREQYSVCQVSPFMFDYMTYCRYFAARDTFLHARLIRTRIVESDWSNSLAKDPRNFNAEALSTSANEFDLPTYCNPWGMPSWTQMKIDGIDQKLLKLYSEYRSAEPEPKPIHSDCPADLIPYLFTHLPSSHGAPRAEQDLGKPYSLHWPLFHKTHGLIEIDKKIAALKPNFTEIKADLRNYLCSDSVAEALTSYYSTATGLSEGRQWVNSIKTEIIERNWRILKDALNAIGQDPKKSLDDAHSLLHAFEEMMGTRWGFHGRQNAGGGSGKALDAWEDVQTAVMMLVNVLLAESRQITEEKLVDFIPWFAENFHSTKELGIHYCPEEASVKGLFNNIDEDKWLANEEFALIGIVRLPSGESSCTRDNLVGALSAWVSESGHEYNIEQIMGLRSSIQLPWKHAEVAWFWPCNRGKPEIQKMARYYALAMEKGTKLA
jgi:hypothetical protein